MKALIKQFIVFGTVGLLNTAIGLGVILFCSEILHINYLLSNVIGYAVGLSIGFWLHKCVTFHETSGLRKTHHQMASFLGVFTVAYAVQFGLLVYLKEGAGMGNVLSQTLACGLYVLVSFAGNRYSTFTAPKIN